MSKPKQITEKEFRKVLSVYWSTMDYDLFYSKLFEAAKDNNWIKPEKTALQEWDNYLINLSEDVIKFDKKIFMKLAKKAIQELRGRNN